jgi:hypothetical protein
MKTTKDCRHLVGCKCIKKNHNCSYPFSGEAVGCKYYSKTKKETVQTPIEELKVVKKKHLLLPSEYTLSDDYPVYFGYMYIVDMKFARCLLVDEFQGQTVSDLKRHLNAKEVRRCELFEHNDARVGDELTTSLE